MKAKYIGKFNGTGFNRHMVFFEYEYSGDIAKVYGWNVSTGKKKEA